jgi:hypothetical protein
MNLDNLSICQLKQLPKSVLYREAFKILKEANDLVLNAREKHLLSINCK